MRVKKIKKKSHQEALIIKEQQKNNVLADEYIAEHKSMEFALRGMGIIMDACVQTGERRKRGSGDYTYPLDNITGGTQIIRARWEFLQRVTGPIDELPLSHRKRIEVKKAQATTKTTMKEMKKRMEEHVVYVGGRKERAFLDVDYLIDPSTLPFKWEQEEWMTYMITSSINMERRRQRRAEEGALMDAVVGRAKICKWKIKGAANARNLEKVKYCLAIQRTTYEEVNALKNELIAYNNEITNEKGFTSSKEQALRVLMLNALLLQLPNHVQAINEAGADLHAAIRGKWCAHCLDSVNEFILHFDYHLERVKMMTHKLLKDELAEGLVFVSDIDYNKQSGFAIYLMF